MMRTRRTGASALFSPTGFCLAALGLLLPFGVVSCDETVGGSLFYSGTDLLHHDGGTATFTPAVLDDPGAKNNPLLVPGTASGLLHDAHIGDVQILLAVFVGLVLAGLIAAPVRPLLRRATFAAALGGAALVVLVGAQIAARRAVVAWFAANPEYSVPQNAGRSLPTEVSLQAGAGFWLSVSVLAAITIGNVVAILWQTRDRPPDDVLPQQGDVPAPV
jgi:hypothetical protein